MQNGNIPAKQEFFLLDWKNNIFLWGKADIQNPGILARTIKGNVAYGKVGFDGFGLKS